MSYPDGIAKQIGLSPLFGSQKQYGQWTEVRLKQEEQQQVFLQNSLNRRDEVRLVVVGRCGGAGRPGGMHKFIEGKISDKLCQMLTPAAPAANFFQKGDSAS